MKKILLLLVLLLVGCKDTEPHNQDIARGYDMSGPLEGCSAHYVIGNSTSQNLYVVRCPAAVTTTTTKIGSKGARTITVMIDGVEYEATTKEKKQ